MRSLLIASLLAFSLTPGSVAAQSLEESYAQLCSKPADAKTEACQVLAKSLMEKLQAQPASPASVPAAQESGSGDAAPDLVGMQRWGFFADLVGQDLIDIQYENPSNITFTPATLEYVWEEPGEVMVLLEKRPDGTVTHGATLQWDATHRGLRETTPGGGASSLYEWQPDGSAIVSAGAARMVFRRLADGALEMLIEDDKGQGWQLMNRRHRVPATAANLETQALMKQVEANMAETQKLMAEITRADAELKASPLWQQTLANQARAEAERKRKAERGSSFDAFLRGVNSALDSGLEVARAQEAQSRYELDSTLADINAQARAQQAAQSQASAMRSGTGYTAQPAAPPASTPPATTTYTAVQGPGTGSWASAGRGSSAGGASSMGTSGSASTRDDASMCVSPPVTSTHTCADLSGYKAMVSNTCAVPVDVRVCFMTDGGWNCQSNYGLAPEATWEPGWCHANTGEVFHAVRYSDSDEPLDQP